MPDPRDVLEQTIEAEVERRVAERLREAQAALIAALDDFVAHAPVAEATGRPPKRYSMTRTDASRAFGVSMSKLRTMERNGTITPRRKGGRIMVDPQEVADALGVTVPGAPPRIV